MSLGQEERGSRSIAISEWSERGARSADSVDCDQRVERAAAISAKSFDCRAGEEDRRPAIKL